MSLHDRILSLRKEHEELLDVAGRLEEFLELSVRHDFKQHLKGFAELRSIENGLSGAVKHCRAGDQIIETAGGSCLLPEERARIDAEHEQIIRLITNFREELKFATADRTMAMILPGMDVVKWLRAHAAYERELIDRIVVQGQPAVRVAAKKKAVKRFTLKKKRHVARRSTKAKLAAVVPYTLEPHPEL